MARLKILIFALLFCSHVLNAGAGSKTWNFEWHTDDMTDNVSCYMSSSTEYFGKRIGKIRLGDRVYLAVQDSGAVSIISSQEPFNPLVKDKIGVRVDKNKPFMGVNLSTQSRIVTFDIDRSIELLKQMSQGEEILVQVAFFPYADLISKKFTLATSKPLSYFTLALSAWKGCQYNKQNTHWTGMLLIESPCNQTCQDDLKTKFKGESESISSVWSANPTKPAGKAGLKEGDSIVGIEGVLRSQKDIISTLDNVPEGGSVTLNVFNFESGKYREVKLSR